MRLPGRTWTAPARRRPGLRGNPATLTAEREAARAKVELERAHGKQRVKDLHDTYGRQIDQLRDELWGCTLRFFRPWVTVPKNSLMVSSARFTGSAKKHPVPGLVAASLIVRFNRSRSLGR
ncbi:hypothetical protein StoSoilB13_10150 [Arthrobacter sp. StoSoilB13]|nr:hypothetical protein StoSoilB13_10150 [Arthrobacter sp. StoSoilB13]